MAYLGFRSIPAPSKAASGETNLFYKIVYVIDGDTIKLSGGERVRLIGIDTPEARYNNKLYRDAQKSGKDIDIILGYGKEASRFTRDLAQGKKARLEFDVERRDRYGRLLAYVYLEDGTFLNARIIEEGYGQVMTVPPNIKYAEYFLKLQQDARKSRRGLWKN